MNSDFSLPSALVEAFRHPESEGRPPWQLVTRKSEIVDDVSKVPDDAEYVATKGNAKNVDRLGELSQLVALWAHIPTSEFFRASARAPHLRALYAVYFKQLDEVPLAGANSLEHLGLTWAHRLVDLSFLRSLPALRTLIIDDMKRLDLTTLPELPQLTGLALGGGMWSTMKIESFEPLTRLPNLRYLQVYSLRTVDGSLKPLAQLHHLRDLSLPNYFSIDEFARLSGALPDTSGNVLTPFYTATDRSDKAPWGCKDCGGPRYMMTGKPAVILCPKCDKTKMDKRLARWEAARASRWPA